MRCVNKEKKKKNSHTHTQDKIINIYCVRREEMRARETE